MKFLKTQYLYLISSDSILLTPLSPFICIFNWCLYSNLLLVSPIHPSHSAKVSFQMQILSYVYLVRPHYCSPYLQNKVQVPRLGNPTCVVRNPASCSLISRPVLLPHSLCHPQLIGILQTCLPLYIV